jgi:hypothetical protein
MGPANKKEVSFPEMDVQASETEVQTDIDDGNFDGLMDLFAQLDVEKDSATHDTLAYQANPVSEDRATNEASAMPTI